MNARLFRSGRRVPLHCNCENPAIHAAGKVLTEPSRHHSAYFGYLGLALPSCILHEADTVEGLWLENYWEPWLGWPWYWAGGRCETRSAEQTILPKQSTRFPQK